MSEYVCLLKIASILLQVICGDFCAKILRDSLKKYLGKFTEVLNNLCRNKTKRFILKTNI